MINLIMKISDIRDLGIGNKFKSVNCHKYQTCAKCKAELGYRFIVKTKYCTFAILNVFLGEYYKEYPDDYIERLLYSEDYDDLKLGLSIMLNKLNIRYD